ncbi:alpha/beta hydrolase family esterase [Dactylosporangium sp. NPDC048998]|uniref:extracellular catalytic domain type 1 short-chain-length polyhydroxyalkanoate depolymerase n=1 Tax=Dactylosporangium sp. NPDC048998 TaxID=3363976 RepID=UPI003717B58F
MAAVGVLIVLIGCDTARTQGQGTATPTAPTPQLRSPAVAVGSTDQTITVDGRKRTYHLYRPAKLSMSKPVPLVVMLHGALGDGRQAEMAYGWDAEADRKGFVVAYPDGLFRSWVVSAECCGPSVNSGVNDVAFIRAMVAAVSDGLPIDPARIYATGISNGGMLDYRLACDTTIFAAIGVVAGKQLGQCPSPAPISVIHVHGTGDDIVPYDSRPGKMNNDGQGLIPVKIDAVSVPDEIDQWRKTARCSAPQTRTKADVTTSVAHCPDGRDVELITIAGAGHQWPGGTSMPAAERMLGLPPPSKALDATDTIWQFFSTHPRKG